MSDHPDYIERFAVVAESTGWPRMMSRVFASLLLTEGGELTAAELGSSLQVGAPAISGAIKTLSQVGLIERRHRPGDRRHYYRVRDDVWFTTIMGYDRTMAAWQHVAEEGVPLFGAETEVARRLEDTADFFAFLRVELPKLMQRWNEERSAADRQA